jgi:hypothetical protein
VEKRASHADASVRRECSLAVPARGMQKLVRPGSVLRICVKALMGTRNCLSVKVTMLSKN